MAAPQTRASGTVRGYRAYQTLSAISEGSQKQNGYVRSVSISAAALAASSALSSASYVDLSGSKNPSQLGVHLTNASAKRLLVGIRLGDLLDEPRLLGGKAHRAIALGV